MSPAKKRGSINLTALGSAAVLAVYAAGYLRTRPATQRFAGNDSERRPSAPTAAPVRIDSARLISAVRTDTVRPPTPAAKPAAKKSPAVAPAPAPKVDSVPSPAESRDTMPPAAPVAQVDTARAVVDSVRALKDGTYTGWGTSRHGDIQAAVEIKGGRIASAYITQCLTRYSCSRIAAIIPQVAERQSPEVDFVSGATQSTNAFYYAIVEALSKAK